jgi:AcrR family transcriptional regulator
VTSAEGAQQPSSPAPRVARRRAAVIEEALNHAIDLMQADGVGALSISEVARRMGIRGPSLYKYFPSLHALYDVLFARGLAGQLEAIADAVRDLPPGVPRVRAAGIAIVRWAVENPALAQLLYWRPVPGFEPSPPTFAPSVRDLGDLRGELVAAVRLGQLSPAADSDDVVLLWTVLISGLISQQLANQPGVPFEQGTFSRLTDQAIDQFLSVYRS